MVEITELPAEQMGTYFRGGGGGTNLAEYTQAIQGLQPGTLAVVGLSGTSERAMKRRLSMAAKQLGWSLKWAPQHPEGALIFTIVGGTTSGMRRGGTGRTSRAGRTNVERQAARVVNATAPVATTTRRRSNGQRGRGRTAVAAR